MKIFNIFFCIIFIIFAGLQYNDPDPYIWMPIYLYAAILCALAARNKFYPLAYWIGIIVYAIYAADEFFSKDGVLGWIQQHHAENIAHTMKAETPWIEETREFFGLVILICVLLINYFYGRRKSLNQNTT
ncbi:MAG: transmembrane 220 family protein [Ginsengibacter sp.]